MHNILQTAFPSLSVSAQVETWPIDGVFTIARGSSTEATVIVVEVTDGTHKGRGESVAMKRYNETIESVLSDIEGIKHSIERGITRGQLQESLKPGAARNALDSALWDFEARESDVPVWKRAGLEEPKPFNTFYTVSLAEPSIMAEKAIAAAANHKTIKIKLGGGSVDRERLEAVHNAVPETSIVVDANESWSVEDFKNLSQFCFEHNVVLIEQPFKSDEDDVLQELEHVVPVCADESAHTTKDLPSLIKNYEAINIKLDKTGGFTEALAFYRAAREANLKIMLGCMVSTSLALAPLSLLAPSADFVDLDGGLLLLKDRKNGMKLTKGMLEPTSPELWG